MKQDTIKSTGNCCGINSASWNSYHIMFKIPVDSSCIRGSTTTIDGCYLIFVCRFGFLSLLHPVKQTVTDNVPTYTEIVETSLSFINLFNIDTKIPHPLVFNKI